MRRPNTNAAQGPYGENRTLIPFFMVKMMRRRNSGIIFILLAIFVLIVIGILVYVYIQNQEYRGSEIAAFRQFAADHNFTVNVGTVSFTNVITLNRDAFEQKCITLSSSENNFSIIEQHTHTWLVFQQSKFDVVDYQTEIVYQWVI